MIERLIQVAREIQFVNPEYFFLFCVPIFLSLLISLSFGYFLWKRPKRTYGSKYSLTGKSGSMLLATTSICFAIIAMTRPITTFPMENYFTGPVDMIAVVDTSSSMWADDLKPSRLDIARRELLNMNIAGMLKEGDRASLIVFGAKPSTRAYLTSELHFFFNEVSALGPPSFISKDRFPWGSDIPGSVKEVYVSSDMLDRFNLVNTFEEFINDDNNWRPDRRTNRFAVFFTDGDFGIDEIETRLMHDAVSELTTRGVTVYAVGIGTRTGVNLLSSIRRIEIDNKAFDEISSDIAGIVTILDMTNISSLTSGAGGDFFIIDNESMDAGNFLNKIVDSHRSSTERAVTSEGTNELWHYFVGLSLIFMILAIIFY